MRERLTARVLLLDADGRLLLMKGRMTLRPDAPSWWFTVGGGVEPGETIFEAARREVAEEAGFSEVEIGPVVWLRDGVGKLASGEKVIFKENYVVARCAGGEPCRDRWEAHEIALMDDLRWWTAQEIAATSEVIYPQNLAELLPDILSGAYPAQPLRLAPY
jgi:8-oxo-dGTP pyrophosphatase MutT (NUDIX family)